MDEGCGCIVILVLLAVLWLSFTIGDALSIDPMWVFGGLIILIIGLIYLFSYLWNRADKKIQNQFKEIKNKYPKAYSNYAAEKGYTDNSKIPQKFKKEVAKRSEYSWKNEEQTLKKNEQDRLKKQHEEEQDRLKKQQEEERAEESRQMKEIERLFPNGLRIWKEKYPMISSNQRYMVRSRVAISILEDEFIAKEELRKKEEIRIANQKREEENNILQNTAKDVLIRKAKSWNILSQKIRYTWLFYYYPTTCDFEATEEEWANRWIIWNFKNTPGKTSESAHLNTLNLVIPMLKDKLLKTFEAKNLKYITLVCIPASSQSKTKARYEEFSQRICNELGMINAYPYIVVTEEKEAKHLGGSDLDTKKLHFDEEFFKGKYVLLFDDIITKGKSMIAFKHKMESLGAIVIGGLALGKTKHERPEMSFEPEAPHIFSDNPNSDDLPF